MDFESFNSEIKDAVEYLRPYVCDTLPILHEAIEKNEKILFEGAQGIMLDIDFGTYPFVTSSNTGTSGVVLFRSPSPKNR